MSDEGKRAYRYEVIETTGEGTKAMGGKPNVIDWKYLGREYTWTIVGAGFEVVGTITGRYLDRGRITGGKYVSDKELAAA